jgi:tetratricopeptide (TPR) repeat protein
LSAPSERTPALRKTAWACAGIIAATFAAYAPVWRAGFIWDDNAHVPRPEMRSWHGLWRIWFDLGSTQQYYPVLHSSFWLEHQLWGDAALGYHLANVSLHAVAACLFALALRRLAMRGAWLAGLLFALHPVGVESVAWISEQKNTLSTVFYLAAVHAYLSYAARRERKERGVWSIYLLATALFVFALLSKTVTATLPAALLVVVWWQRGRLRWKKDIVPLVPWLGLGAAAGLFSAWVERTYVGAEGTAFQLSAAERCLLAGRAIWFYLGKLLWPADLMFIYPRWQLAASSVWPVLFPVAALGLLAGCWLLRRRTRAPLAAALFFIGSLFPTLGFFNVFAFVYSYVTDHWQYLASLGIIALAAAAWAQWAASGGGGRAAPRWVAVAIAGVLGVLTWRQCETYRDPETFYRASVQRNPEDWMGHNNLGDLLVRSGRAAEAVDHYERALRLAPDLAEIEYNLGGALLQLGRGNEAIPAYLAAIRLHPDYPDAEVNLGQTLVAVGRLPEAIPHFEAALRSRPADADSEAALGLALAHTGRLPEAIAHYQSALRLNANLPEAHNNLGSALASSGRLSEAIVQFGEAARLRPSYGEARANLASALGNSGRLPEAIVQYEQILQQHPDNADAHANLGLALVQTGRVAEALDHLGIAVRLQPRSAGAHAYLGFALARAGRFAQAVRAYRDALRINPNDADTHYQLGVALRQLGALAEARGEFETADRLSK